MCSTSHRCVFDSCLQCTTRRDNIPQNMHNVLGIYLLRISMASSSFQYYGLFTSTCPEPLLGLEWSARCSWVNWNPTPFHQIFSAAENKIEETTLSFFSFQGKKQEDKRRRTYLQVQENAVLLWLNLKTFRLCKSQTVFIGFFYVFKILTLANAVVMALILTTIWLLRQVLPGSKTCRYWRTSLAKPSWISNSSAENGKKTLVQKLY